MVGFETSEDLEKRGHTAFVEEEYDEAVNLYTEALALEPSNASLLIARANVHIMLENYTGNSGKLGFRKRLSVTVGMCVDVLPDRFQVDALQSRILVFCSVF